MLVVVLELLGGVVLMDEPLMLPFERRECERWPVVVPDIEPEPFEPLDIELPDVVEPLVMPLVEAPLAEVPPVIPPVVDGPLIPVEPLMPPVAPPAAAPPAAWAKAEPASATLAAAVNMIFIVLFMIFPPVKSLRD